MSTSGDAGQPLSGELGFDLPDWWKHIRKDAGWQAGAFYGLAAAYALLAAVALVQLVRISRRCPQYGWTTQKVFHLLNLLVCILRAVVMALHSQLEGLHSPVLKLLFNDLPGLLFFTTYTLLVLFWAGIYHQARSQATARLRPTFLAVNVAVYAVQVCLLLLCGFHALHRFAAVASSVFLVLVSLAAAAGFVTYGGRLWLMLHRFPIESPGRLKKLREVGIVTTVCTTCFTARALLVALSALDATDFRLDVTGHPLLDVIYYTLVEVLPSASVLFILRKLPPKRTPVYTAPEPPMEA